VIDILKLISQWFVGRSRVDGREMDGIIGQVMVGIRLLLPGMIGQDPGQAAL